MYWYVQVHSCWSMYKYIEVYTSTYWYVHVCTMYLYIPGHTSMSYVGEVGTGSSMYWYVLVHTSMYWYVHVRTVYNGIYYHVYLCVHAMKAPLRHLKRVASRTHYAQELLWLPFDTAKSCQGTIHNMRLQNMIQLSGGPPTPPGARASSHIALIRKTQRVFKVLANPFCQNGKPIPHSIQYLHCYMRYVPVHTSIYWYILVCTSMYLYVYVCTGTYQLVPGMY